MKIISFCITHETPKVPIDDETFVVWLGEKDCPFKDTNKTIIVSDLYDDLDFYRKFLLGSAGSIAIARYIKESGFKYPQDLLIKITSYRKLVCNKSIGENSFSYPSMRLVRSTSEIKQEYTLPQHEEFLIATPINFHNGYLGQYCQVHNVEDFLRYSAIALELGVISDQKELPLFFDCNTFIPGGFELGVFPLHTFIKATEEIEKISLAFCEKHRPASFDKYQKRALSFCNERMGSYLLIKEILKKYNDIPESIIGYLVTIEEGNDDYQGNRS